MDKRVLCVLLLTGLSLSMFSQVSFHNLYADFSNEEDVVKINIGGLLMGIAKPFIRKETSGVKISGMNLISLEDCSSDVKNRFNEQACVFRDDNYELFLNTNEKGERTRIFLRFDHDIVREMVIISTGDSPMMLRLKGKIKREDVHKFIESGKND